MARRHVERKVVEPVAIGAPDDGADDLEECRDPDEDEHLDPKLARLERERDAEEEPRRQAEDRLTRDVALAVQGQRERDERGERDQEREGAAGRERSHSTVMVLILSPMFTPFTTSIPLVTWPKFVYCL